MSTERNKALIRRLFDEVLNGGKLGLLDQLVGSSYVEHNPVANQAAGGAGVRVKIEAMKAAFPDLRFTLEELIAEGEIVAARYYWRGTHKGTFLGIAPTGRRLSVRGMDFYRLEDGRLIEHWEIVDEFGMLSQLGDLG
ncbi:MAG: ester cyclase [Acidobacteriota bacterium]